MYIIQPFPFSLLVLIYSSLVNALVIKTDIILDYFVTTSMYASLSLFNLSMVNMTPFVNSPFKTVYLFSVRDNEALHQGYWYW